MKRTSTVLTILTICIAQIRGWIAATRRNDTRNRCRCRSASSDSEHILRKLLLPSEKCQVEQMSSTDLAYVGDAVYELMIRTLKVWPSKRTSDLQSQVVSIVNGKCSRQMIVADTFLLAVDTHVCI